MEKKEEVESKGSENQFEKKEGAGEISQNKLFDLAKNLAVLIDKIDKEKH